MIKDNSYTTNELNISLRSGTMTLTLKYIMHMHLLAAVLNILHLYMSNRVSSSDSLFVLLIGNVSLDNS